MTNSVRDQLGLRNSRWCYTGGAPLGPDTYRFFRSFGINLKQVYGSTETTGLVSLQPSREANPTTAGRPCAGIEVRIGDGAANPYVVVAAILAAALDGLRRQLDCPPPVEGWSYDRIEKEHGLLDKLLPYSHYGKKDWVREPGTTEETS